MALQQPYSVELFVRRALALAHDFDGKTDKGNQLPVLLSPRLAFPDGTVESGLPLQFYEEANWALCRLKLDRAVFPTNMFDEVEVCLMQRSLMIGLHTESIVDAEAGLFLESAEFTHLKRIVGALQLRMATGGVCNA